MSSREKQKKEEKLQTHKTHCTLQDQRGLAAAPGLKIWIEISNAVAPGLEYSRLSFQIWSLHVPIFWIGDFKSAPRPNILSGLRSQIRSLHVPIFWIEISNTIAPGLKIWFFFLRSQITDEHGEHSENSIFWELRGTIRLTASSVSGNFIEQVLLTVSFLGTLWNKFS